MIISIFKPIVRIQWVFRRAFMIAVSRLRFRVVLKCAIARLA